MAPAREEGGEEAMAGEGEGRAHVRRVTARSAARCGREEMDRERLRRRRAGMTKTRRLRYVVAGDGATEKGARTAVPLVE